MPRIALAEGASVHCVVDETHRVYRPDLLGCGLSDQPPCGYRYTPETIGAQILAVLDGLSLSKMHCTAPGWRCGRDALRRAADR
jgi:pimeloyl-ACP methyl ester carboxylesterase